MLEFFDGDLLRLIKVFVRILTCLSFFQASSENATVLILIIVFKSGQHEEALLF